MQLTLLQSNSGNSSSRASRAQIAARALALFFGSFSLVNLLGNLRSPGFDASLWWIDLRVFPEPLATIFLLLSSLCLLSFAFRPPQARWLRVLTSVVLGLLSLLTLWNTPRVLFSPWPGPAPALVAGSPVPLFSRGFRFDPPRQFAPRPFRFIPPASLRPSPPSLPRSSSASRWPRSFASAIPIIAARPMSPSSSAPASMPMAGLRMRSRDRVKTACQLYRDGLVKKLIFSGGPGDGPVHETESMRRLALRLGVNPADILTDTAGLNSQATVNNTLPLFRQLGAHRVIAVSHFYHLPRIKLAYQRAGWDVYTVPAKETDYCGKLLSSSPAKSPPSGFTISAPSFPDGICHSTAKVLLTTAGRARECPPSRSACLWQRSPKMKQTGLSSAPL